MGQFISHLTKGEPICDWNKDNGLTLNPYIIGEIFQYLDLDTLKLCRLVCKDWNAESLRILSSLICFRVSQVELKCREKYKCSNYRGSTSTSIEAEPGIYFWKMKFGALEKCLDNSNYAEQIFKDFHCRCRRGQEFRESLEKLLLKYGKYLENIQLYPGYYGLAHSHDQRIYYKILHSWCPNLKRYELNLHDTVKNLETMSENKLTPLHLEELVIYCYRVPTFQNTKIIGNWVSRVLSESPRLSRLNIAAVGDGVFPIVFKFLNTYPNSAENLLEFESCVIETDSEDYEEFSAFLNKMVKLRKLTLHGDGLFPSKICFKGMKNTLQYLYCNGIIRLAPDETNDNLLNCTKWFPNLKSFYAHGVKRWPLNRASH